MVSPLFAADVILWSHSVDKMVPRCKLSIQLTISMDLLLETASKLLEKGLQQINEFHFSFFFV